MTRVEIKEFAKKKIKGNLWLIWRALLIVSIITGFFSYSKDTYSLIDGTFYWIIYFVLAALVSPINVGLNKYIREVNKDHKPSIDVLFEYFKFFKNIFFANLFTGVIISIGYSLLIVPGIIASLALVLVNYYFVDHPEAEIMEAIKHSYEKMHGKMWDLFVFYLSFIGTILLMIITFGIYTIWGAPYISCAINKYLFNIEKN